jgi:intermediate filament protein if
MSMSSKTRTTTVEGPASSVKTTTTTYKTTSSYESDLPSSTSTYKPVVHPRTTIIQRTVAGSGPQMGYSSRIERSSGYSMYGAPAAGSYSTITNTGVTNVKESRDREKKDMQDLNERFASYIEKVRFLEAQNRKLSDELDKLKSKWGKETTAIKAMYQAELDEARKLLDDAEKDKAQLEIKVASLEEQLEEMRNKLQDAREQLAESNERCEHQLQQLSDYEAEINLLRRRVEGLERDRDRDKKEIVRLTDALNAMRMDLDQETLAHVDAENRRQTLEEEIEFLKAVHEQEMKELAALAYRDTTAENREFWKNELGGCLREIQETYDDKLATMKGEMETFYNLKLQEFRTGATRQNMETVHAKEETKRLRNQLTDLRQKLADAETRNAALEKELELLRREYSDKEREWEAENSELKSEIAKLRAEMESIMKELQDLMDTKLGLELEISAYRKLLEGEENRIGLRNVVETMMTGGTFEQDADDSSLKVSQVVKGEMSAKTTYQRSAKGPVSIAECTADGKCIVLENTGRKEESLGGWSIKRNIDGMDKANVTLDKNFAIRPGGKVKIFAAGQRPGNSGPYDIECNVQSWGIGANITTTLINAFGESRATHNQRTSYTS